MAYKLLYLARRAPTVSWDDWPRTWNIATADTAWAMTKTSAARTWMRVSVGRRSIVTPTRSRVSRLVRAQPALGIGGSEDSWRL